MAFHLYSRGRASGVYLQNAPIFPTNLIPDIREGFDAIWNISIITTTTSVFEYSIDGGVTYFPLGTATANQELTMNVKADDKDSFNLRITDVAGATVFRIVVSIAPEDIMRALQPLKVQINEPLKVDICPVNCDVPVDIQNQPISVVFPTPVSVTFPQPITVTQSANPLPVSFATPVPVDICPVTCEIDVDINSISFGTIPVSFAQPISVTETNDPKNVAITGQPISVVFAQPITVTQSVSPLPVDICPVSCDVPIINGSVSPLLVSVVFPTGTPIGVTRVNLTNSAYTTPNDVFPAISPSGTVAGTSVMMRVQWTATDGGKLSYTLNDSDFVTFNDENQLKKILE